MGKKIEKKHFGRTGSDFMLACQRLTMRLAKGKVLIVDDSWDFARLLQKGLENVGRQADIAANAKDARALLSRHRDSYKAIIIDYHLQHELGTTLIEDARKAKVDNIYIVSVDSEALESIRQSESTVAVVNKDFQDIMSAMGCA